MRAKFRVQEGTHDVVSIVKAGRADGILLASSWIYAVSLNGKRALTLKTLFIAVTAAAAFLGAAVIAVPSADDSAHCFPTEHCQSD